MDLYTLTRRARAPRRPARSSARIGDSRGAITRASTRAIASPRRCSGRSSSAYEVLGDMRAAARVRPRRPARARRRQLEATVVLRGLRFLGAGRGPARGDVLGVVRGCVSGRRARGDHAERGRADRRHARACRSRTRVRGGQFPLSVVRQERCATCGGDGRVPRPSVACPACGGTGSRRWARGHMVFTKACDACDGSGRLTTSAVPRRAPASGVRRAARS